MVKSKLLTVLLIIVPLTAFAALTSSTVPVHTHASNAQGGSTLSLTGAFSAASIATSGTLSSTKSCASGYTRRLPNFCQWGGSAHAISWVDATACTARTASSNYPIPADAKLILIQVNWSVLAGNAVGARRNDVFFFPTSICGAWIATSTAAAYEHVAVVSGTLAETKDRVTVVPAATNTFYTTQTNAGGAGNADVASHIVLGYYD